MSDFSWGGSLSSIYGFEDFMAGLPRAGSARGTETYTHRIWLTSFRLVITGLTERTYARTRLQIVRVR